LRYLSPPEHADPTLKEKALARTTPLHAKPGRYQRQGRARGCPASRGICRVR